MSPFSLTIPQYLHEALKNSDSKETHDPEENQLARFFDETKKNMRY